MKDSIRRKNFYELLGVDRDATELELQLAFADLSRIYDPESDFFADLIDDPVTDEQREVFERIKEAFNTLTDPQSRAEYDKVLDGVVASDGLNR